jgi:hypothetical protein
MRFEFARFASPGISSLMNSNTRTSTNPLIRKIHQLFRRDLAGENNYLRQDGTQFQLNARKTAASAGLSAYSIQTTTSHRPYQQSGIGQSP